MSGCACGSLGGKPDENEGMSVLVPFSDQLRSRSVGLVSRGVVSATWRVLGGVLLQRIGLPSVSAAALLLACEADNEPEWLYAGLRNVQGAAQREIRPAHPLEAAAAEIARGKVREGERVALTPPFSSSSPSSAPTSTSTPSPTPSTRSSPSPSPTSPSLFRGLDAFQGVPWTRDVAVEGALRVLWDGLGERVRVAVGVLPVEADLLWWCMRGGCAAQRVVWLRAAAGVRVLVVHVGSAWHGIQVTGKGRHVKLQAMGVAACEAVRFLAESGDQGGGSMPTVQDVSYALIDAIDRWSMHRELRGGALRLDVCSAMCGRFSHVALLRLQPDQVLLVFRGEEKEGEERGEGRGGGWEEGVGEAGGGEAGGGEERREAFRYSTCGLQEGPKPHLHSATHSATDCGGGEGCHLHSASRRAHSPLHIPSSPTGLVVSECQRSLDVRVWQAAPDDEAVLWAQIIGRWHALHPTASPRFLLQTLARAPLPRLPFLFHTLTAAGTGNEEEGEEEGGEEGGEEGEWEEPLSASSSELSSHPTLSSSPSSPSPLHPSSSPTLPVSSSTPASPPHPTSEPSSHPSSSSSSPPHPSPPPSHPPSHPPSRIRIASMLPAVVGGDGAALLLSGRRVSRVGVWSEELAAAGAARAAWRGERVSSGQRARRPGVVAHTAVLLQLCGQEWDLMLEAGDAGGDSGALGVWCKRLSARENERMRHKAERCIDGALLFPVPHSHQCSTHDICAVLIKPYVWHGAERRRGGHREEEEGVTPVAPMDPPTPLPPALPSPAPPFVWGVGVEYSLVGSNCQVLSAACVHLATQGRRGWAWPSAGEAMALLLSVQRQCHLRPFLRADEAALLRLELRKLADCLLLVASEAKDKEESGKLVVSKIASSADMISSIAKKHDSREEGDGEGERYFIPPLSSSPSSARRFEGVLGYPVVDIGLDLLVGVGLAGDEEWERARGSAVVDRGGAGEEAHLRWADALVQMARVLEKEERCVSGDSEWAAVWRGLLRAQVLADTAAHFGAEAMHEAQQCLARHRDALAHPSVPALCRNLCNNIFGPLATDAERILTNEAALRAAGKEAINARRALAEAAHAARTARDELINAIQDFRALWNRTEKQAQGSFATTDAR